MGCDSCSTGKPTGCKSNGTCGTSGCNRLNVYDWLANLPFSDPESSCRIVEVSFNNGSRKDFYRNSTVSFFDKGDMVAVEGVNGFDVGEVMLTGELVRVQMKKKGVKENSSDIKKILRLASDHDLDKWKETKSRERDVLIRSRAIAKQLNLEMKMAEVEIQADGRKATFYYIADERVDFRELIRVYASEFKVKVEMKQIGARQEAGKVGGIGSCGRELCCSTWLTEFKSVNTNAARYQNLSINQTKLSGQCGRLKCCLNYELDTYLDALRNFPDDADVLDMRNGRATLVKKDIFRNLMWYSLPDTTKYYPLAIETVKKIKMQNAEGIRPEMLETVEVVSGREKEVEPEFVDVVGQISLRSLEKKSRRQQGGRNRPEGRGRTEAPNRAEGKGRPDGSNRQEARNRRPADHTGEAGGQKRNNQNNRPKGSSQKRSRGKGNQPPSAPEA